MGIYCITNLINNLKYIGSSKEIKRREIVHFSELKRGCHINSYLQNAYNKYGKDSFSFEIIEVVEDETALLSREQYWIDLLGVTKREVGFNLQEKAGRTTPWITKKHHSNESKQKSSISNTGKKRSDVTKERLRLSHLGKKQTEETKTKISLILRGNPKLASWKGKSSPMKGRKHTTESIRKRTETRRLNRERKNDLTISIS